MEGNALSTPHPASRPSADASQPAVELVRVSKTFGAARAVREVSFRVAPGEFFSMLGPSGCGKTTTLRLIAGFEQPDADGGELRLGGQRVNGLRPYDRNLGMVFQSYALFPHLSVEKNIAFGLVQHGVAKADIAPRVTEAMRMVRLDEATYARRMPAQLSGGQRQRVALARALVCRPPILLLDEPLGALDLQLRKEMQLELKQLNRQLGITFIYVTHDQEEALTMSDRIAVMDNARVAQLGSPAEIYERPRTAFVARFIGACNFLNGTVQAVEDDLIVLRHPGGHVFRAERHAGSAVGAEVQLALRPERVQLQAGPPPPGASSLPGRVEQHVYRGEMLHVRVALDGGGALIIAARNDGQLRTPYPFAPGQPVHAVFAPLDAHVLEVDPDAKAAP